jgi:hypothetical protein
MDLPALSSVLWRERDLLGLVVTGLEQPDAPAARSREDTDLALALSALEDVQRHRRLVVDGAGTALGLPAGCTLADVAGVAPEPWADLLRLHITALIAGMDDVVKAAGDGVVLSPLS